MKGAMAIPILCFVSQRPTDPFFSKPKNKETEFLISLSTLFSQVFPGLIWFVYLYTPLSDWDIKIRSYNDSEAPPGGSHPYPLTLSQRKSTFVDIWRSRYWTTCDVIIFDVTKLFWLAANTARTDPSTRVSIFNIDQILAELFQKNVSNFGCKTGGKIG